MQDFFFSFANFQFMMHGPYFQVENETNYGQNIPMWSHAMKLDAVGLTFLIIRGLDTYIYLGTHKVQIFWDGHQNLKKNILPCFDVTK